MQLGLYIEANTWYLCNWLYFSINSRCMVLPFMCSWCFNAIECAQLSLGRKSPMRKYKPTGNELPVHEYLSTWSVNLGWTTNCLKPMFSTWLASSRAAVHDGASLKLNDLSRPKLQNKNIWYSKGLFVSEWLTVVVYSPTKHTFWKTSVVQILPLSVRAL